MPTPACWATAAIGALEAGVTDLSAYQPGGGVADLELDFFIDALPAPAVAAGEGDNGLPS